MPEWEYDGEGDGEEGGAVYQWVRALARVWVRRLERVKERAERLQREAEAKEHPPQN